MAAMTRVLVMLLMLTLLCGQSMASVSFWMRVFGIEPPSIVPEGQVVLQSGQVVPSASLGLAGPSNALGGGAAMGGGYTTQFGPDGRIIAVPMGCACPAPCCANVRSGRPVAGAVSVGLG
ncbi:uncharacterized protein LOC108595941 [Drosophila busckii]|uniref:uncharacterized protein LOC108595941 n=1 Tax=Drosophila busckii TaxID=30019 RepID=UPI00083EA7A9|nr:uncharacterized protein LOC108595941 [Drosophila busckii]